MTFSHKLSLKDAVALKQYIAIRKLITNPTYRLLHTDEARDIETPAGITRTKLRIKTEIELKQNQAQARIVRRHSKND